MDKSHSGILSVWQFVKNVGVKDENWKYGQLAIQCPPKAFIIIKTKISPKPKNRNFIFHTSENIVNRKKVLANVIFCLPCSSKLIHMSKILLGFVFLSVFITPVGAQNKYINGTLGTGQTTLDGTAVPPGYQWSEVSGDGSLNGTNTVYGFAASGGSTIADDFTVPAGETWNISQFSFYAYETGYFGTDNPLNLLAFQIWDGDPQVPGSTVVFGDLTTNRITSYIDSLTLREANTLLGTAVSYQRVVYRENCDVAVQLQEGTYWVEFVTGSLSGLPHFCPPVTIVGLRGKPGANAKQRNLSTNAWAAANDRGSNPLRANNVRQDFPFEITYDLVLPVSFTSFSGSINNYVASLNWKTATENNNKGFEIERSIDGINYSAIGFVAGAGNTTITNSYSYNDVNLKALNVSTIYYRLKQVDLDGKSSYSQVLPLKMSWIKEWKVLPNPLTAQSLLHLTLEKPSNVSIRILTSDGRVLRTISSGFLAEGTHQINLGAGSLANGVYIMQVQMGEESFSTQLIK
jgi:hypothetical protein